MSILTSTEKAGGDDVTASNNNQLRDDIILTGGDIDLSAAGSSNAYTASIDATVTSLTSGMPVKFKANHANTGAATLNVNSIGAVSLKRVNGDELRPGDIVNGQHVVVIYDGTNFIIISSLDKKQEFTYGENINGTSTPVPVYISDGTGGRTTGSVYQSDANDSSNEARHFYGFAVDNITATNTGTVCRGVVGGFSSLTVGSYYYVQDTAGTIGTSVGSAEICVGRAISATEIDTSDVFPGAQFISSVTAGSSADGATITSPGIARKAIISVTTPITSTGKEEIGEITLYRNGKTSGTFQGVGNVIAEVAVTASWSSNTITFTSTSNGGSASMANVPTAYFFR